VTDDEASPLESAFNLPPGSTPPIIDVSMPNTTSFIDNETGELVTPEVDDSEKEIDRQERLEDIEIMGEMSNVHEMALQTFRAQLRHASEVDPRFAARSAEVAAQYLKIALDATNSKVDAKYKRNKIKLAKQAASGSQLQQHIQGTMITANRNDLLRSILQDHNKDKEDKDPS